MIGTVMPPLEDLPTDFEDAAARSEGLPPHFVAGEDARAAAEAALAYERAAVWVGATGSPEYMEFRAEIGRAR